MNLFISTNLLDPVANECLYNLMEQFSDAGLGVEIFPHFHENGYADVLTSKYEMLKDVPITFHEPYYGAEHSAAKGTPEYKRTMDYCKSTFEWTQRFRCRHIVYHLNNRAVEPAERKKALGCALENLQEMRELAEKYGQKLLIENTGIAALGNVLVNQEQFIGLMRQTGFGCLIDIGHANCNGWDLAAVLRELKGKIHSYHLHNNGGVNDEHRRILDGTLDTAKFFRLYNEYTPAADLVLEYHPGLMGDHAGLKDDIAYILNMK